MGKKDHKKKSHKKEKKDKKHHTKSTPAKKRVKKACSTGPSSTQRKALLQVNKSLGALQKKLSKALGN
jgi:hypothetical protein